jgi:hypothetical protein
MIAEFFLATLNVLDQQVHMPLQGFFLKFELLDLFLPFKPTPIFIGV